MMCGVLPHTMSKEQQARKRLNRLQTYHTNGAHTITLYQGQGSYNLNCHTYQQSVDQQQNLYFLLQKNQTFTGRSKGVSVGTHRSISFCNQWFCMCVYFCSQQHRVVKSLIAIMEEICLVCHLQLRLDNSHKLGGLFFRNQ